MNRYKRADSTDIENKTGSYQRYNLPITKNKRKSEPRGGNVQRGKYN